MLSGNIEPRPVLLHLDDITLSLYDEAQVALRSRRIEKEQVAQSQGHSGMYQQVTVLAYSSLTIYLIYTTQPSWSQCTGKKPLIRACGLHPAGHSVTVNTMAISVVKSLTCKHQSMHYGFMFLFRTQQLLLGRKQDLTQFLVAQECK